MKLNSTHGWLRMIGLAEGISLLLLMGVAMPLKYYMGMPEPNKVLGMLHGLLFIGYVVMVLMVQSEMKWKYTTTALLLAASIIPFGTIYADKKVFKKLN